MGYRLAMILSGGIALILTDPAQGGGWSWPLVYRFMAALMFCAAVLSAIALPRVPMPDIKPTAARHDVIGFLAVLAAVAAGYLLADRFAPPLAHALLVPRLEGSSLATTLKTRWENLLALLLLGIGFTLPPAASAARRARFETLLGGPRSYFSQRGAATFLPFIVLYKLGDAFAGSLMTPFLLKSMAFSPAEVGVVNKVICLWLTIGGALLGGLLMLKLGLWRSLLLFGTLQAVKYLGSWWLAVSGKGLMPGLVLPAFDWASCNWPNRRRWTAGC